MCIDVRSRNTQTLPRMSMREVMSQTVEMPSRPESKQTAVVHRPESKTGSLMGGLEDTCGPAMEVSIVIADPMAITSELLTAALSKRNDFTIVGCAKSMEELVGMLSGRGADIVLIKSSSKGGMFTPLTILSTVFRVSPLTRSIVLSADLTREDVVSYFHAQARGILPADITDFETLCKCIYSVHRGQIWASSEQLNFLIESLSGPKPLQIVDANGDMVLSVREQEVLNLLAEGRSNRAMAEALNLSEHTIKNHLFHIFYKLGVSNRAEAILCAMRQRTVAQNRSVS